MLHQKMPPYEGSKPFLYACYCPEDEHIAFPIIARMYNEGFRIWCVNASGVAADFRSMQRLGSASFVMMFMSRAMAEQLRYGNAECIAVARSSTLRTVVLLDDYTPPNSSFAASTPDRVVYRPENDAPFWLYAYSADHFERCRGSWPAKKLLLREPRYGDVDADQLFDEYSRLESILGTVSEQENEPETLPEAAFDMPEPVRESVAASTIEQPQHIHQAEQAEQTEQPATRRVAQPEDRFFYIPLAIMPIDKLEAERSYAELSEIISSEPEKQTEQNVAPAEELAPPSRAFEVYSGVAGAKKAEPVHAKAEGRVTETSYFVPEAEHSEPDLEKFMPKPIFVPDPEQEKIAEAAPTQSCEPAEEPAPEIVEEPIEVAPTHSEPAALFAENDNVSVKVMVRKPRRTKVSVKTLAEKDESEQEGEKRIINATVPFEKYIRAVALSAVESERARLAAQAGNESARVPSLRRAFAQPTKAVTVRPETLPVELAHPARVEQPVSTAPVTENVEGEKPSPRKNKYPHVKGALAGVLAALRSERRARAASGDDGDAQDPEQSDTQSGSAADAAMSTQKASASQNDGEDALRAAVNKFLEIDSDESICV